MRCFAQTFAKNTILVRLRNRIWTHGQQGISFRGTRGTLCHGLTRDDFSKKCRGSCLKLRGTIEMRESYLIRSALR